MDMNTGMEKGTDKDIDMDINNDIGMVTYMDTDTINRFLNISRPKRLFKDQIFVKYLT